MMSPLIGAMAWSILGNEQNGLINIVSRFFGLGTVINIESFPGLVLVLLIYTLPFVFLVVSASLKRQDPDLEQASRICGAGNTLTLFSVTLPLIRPAIIAGSFLAFIVAAEMFAVHAVLAIPAGIPLLTTEIYSKMSVPPLDIQQATVLASTLLALTLLALYMQARSAGRREYTTARQHTFPSVISLGRWKYASFSFVLGYIALAVILPVFVLLIRSFKPYVFGNNSSLSDIFSGWTLQSYLSLFDYGIATRAFTNSLYLSIAAALAVVAFTAISSYLITKTTIRGRNALWLLCVLPIAIPGVVLGVGIILSYSTPILPLYGTAWVLLIAYIIIGMPFGMQSIMPSFLQIHKEWEESAAICGASWAARFKSIILPLIRFDLLVAFAFVFLLAFKDIGTSILLFTNGGEVVGVMMFNFWSEGLFSLVSAAAILTLVATFIIIAASQHLHRRAEA